MSLLEDIFLHDEANEAQELERVIEGGDYEERVSNSDDNSEKEDEAEEDKKRVDPGSTKVKRIVKNPRFILNPARLTGPRGIQVIPEHFKDFKFKGKCHEKEDLDLVLKKLEHWAYRLYPKFKFEDCLKKIETLGKKRPVMVHLQKIRSDQFISDELVVQKDSSDEETAEPEPDEFDKLLQQQIELARATPAFANRSIDTSVENRSLAMPKATSSPSISDEQRERMLLNRKLAEERRLAKFNNSNSNTPNSSNIPNVSVGNISIQRKTNALDSSDEENAGQIITEGQTKLDESENIESNKKRLPQRKRKMNAIDSSDEMSDEEINEPKNSSKDDNSDTETVQFQGKKGKANTLHFTDDENDDQTSIPIQKESINEHKNEESATISLRNNVSQETMKSDELDDDYKKNENNELNRSSGLDVRDVVLENSIIQSTIQGLVENDNNINLERDLNHHGDSLENEGAINVNEQNEDLMDLDFSEDF